MNFGLALKPRLLKFGLTLPNQSIYNNMVLDLTPSKPEGHFLGNVIKYLTRFWFVPEVDIFFYVCLDSLLKTHILSVVCMLVFCFHPCYIYITE